MRDVSDYSKSELIHKLHAAQKNELMVRSLIDDSPIGMYRTSRDGDVLYANKALASILGYPSVDALCRINIYEKGVPSHRERHRFMREIEKTGVVKGFESVWMSTDGKSVHIREYARKVVDETGAMIYYEGTIEDITEQKEIESKLRNSYRKLKTTLDEFVETLSTAVHIRDPYTAGHQTRVARLVVLIAERLGLDEQTIYTLRTAALLHDIGKIYIPAEILSRPGTLKFQEMELIRTHPEVGHEIIRNISFDSPVADIVSQHHEYLDGSGYPAGLTADSILPEAKILTVADIAEALLSHRPYRPAFTIENARNELQRMKVAKLDPRAVDVCIDIIDSGAFVFS